MTQTSNRRSGRLTTADLARAQSHLTAERTRLREQLATIRADALTNLGLPQPGDDQSDAGARTSWIDQESAVSDNTRLLLEQTAAALTRIEDGTYGTCQSCQHSIGAARLRAFPRATLCLDCRALAEHH